ncbi:oxygenase MpaB family protein [Filimonas effusa]|uniref:DUF2236 domain-containing protein n=1 Tax=Filimonas effusa TaxID=2508721 RepID=A0A4Q1DC52_9BACT|nr:oxygenase MpaB family protein [Filimonas effusa]RXK87061.1 DUF2236 domain-containing protein [Filimonas effusa]
MNQPFVSHDSIVRKIWGNEDTVLLIFAGAAAEFALNKAVDWLYFTGRLPSDPLGRLFSTVQYAQQIVFADTLQAHAAIDRIAAIHNDVEAARNSRIPDVAYLEVLYMLIDYSIRSYELIERPLTKQEHAAVFDVFHRVGQRMQLASLPPDLASWQQHRQYLLENNLLKSDFTNDLYAQYKKHLGHSRFKLLLHAQQILTPSQVRLLLPLPRFTLLRLALPFYKFARFIKADQLIKQILLPQAYKMQIRALRKR